MMILIINVNGKKSTGQLFVSVVLLLIFEKLVHFGTLLIICPKRSEPKLLNSNEIDGIIVIV